MADTSGRLSERSNGLRAGGFSGAIWQSLGTGGPRRWLAAVAGGEPVKLGGTFEREMEEGRGFLWTPVFFGVGILVYFTLPHEPSMAALVALAAMLALAAWVARGRPAVCRVLIVLAAVAAGTTAMKLRTDQVAAPMLTRELTAEVSGWVEAREGARGGVRVLVRVHSIDGLAPAETPRSVRFTVRTKTETIAVGDAIIAKVRLQPPSGPVIPGGFDFALAAFYERMGAVGFAYGAVGPAEIGPAPISTRLWRPIELLREAIRARVETALPGDRGRIAAALIMGDQGGISEATQEAMRASGLGHVLSISGLHMALVAGSAFWLIRALLALSQSLALRRPIKKWAAAGGLIVATIYLGISGGGVATERAFVMLAIMLLAVMLDRRALTLRNVALAALVVLLLAPESLLSASFQMSFAATLALVAAYGAIALRADNATDLRDRAGHRPLAHIWLFAAGLFLTSLVAGLATTPFGAYHFQRLAPLSLFANLAAMPAVSVLVMPMALLAVLLMPLGLESVPLAAMDWGLRWMMIVAETTAAWSGEAGAVKMAPAAALLLEVAGFLWLALWRERWRVLGVVPIGLGLLVAFSSIQPDVLVAADGRTVAVRGSDDRYQILGGKDARFEVENWLRSDGDTRAPDAETLRGAARCDPLGCVGRLKTGEEVALVFRPDAFAEDCRRAAIIVTSLRAPDYCSTSATVIDRGALARSGAQALFLEPPASSEAAPSRPWIRVETAYPANRRAYMPPIVEKRLSAPSALSSAE